MSAPCSTRIRDDVITLASREFRGRGITGDLWKPAAQFIRNSFREIGLDVPDGYEDYGQEFAVQHRRVRPNGLLVLEETPLPLGQSARLAAVGSRTVCAPLALVGFGTSSPVYDDYAGMDISGRIAVTMTGNHPRLDETGTSNWDEYKVLNALHHGARGLLIIEELPLEGGAKQQLPGEGPTSPFFPRALNWARTRFGQPLSSDLLDRIDSFPVAYIHVDEMASLLEPHGIDIHHLHQQILCDRQPNSKMVDLPCQISCQVDIESIVLANVLGISPSSVQRGRHIVIGAHYDHLGEDVSADHFFPGADDNASGVAALLETARCIADHPRPQTVLFVAFTAEEIGTLGSEYYVNHPVYPLDSAGFMVDMDSIGRGEPGSIYAHGHPQLVRRVQEMGRHVGLSVEPSENGGDSDPFIERGVPSVLLWDGGAGPDQHRPTDTPDKLDYDKIRRCVEVAVALCEDVENDWRSA